MERLQKVLAQAGIASRRKSEELILSGKVAVNGEIVRELGTKVDPATDDISVEGKPISKEEHVYILLYKPRGVVTTAADPQGRKTVIQLVDVPQRVYPVGRLDLDTSGLLILTNDGNLANGLIHPRYEVDKRYRTEVKGFISDAEIKQLEQGVLLEDGWTSPAKVKLLKRTDIRSVFDITIHEGRNRQVRRMCDAVGHPVLVLQRIQLAFLTLGNLKPGEWRNLSQAEISRLYEIAGLG